MTNADAHTSGIGEVVGSGGFAIAVIGLCVLVTSTPLTWVVLPLRAVGAMALTAYSGQLIAWALLQPTPAPGESKLSAFRALEPFWPFTHLDDRALHRMGASRRPGADRVGHRPHRAIRRPR